MHTQNGGAPDKAYELIDFAAESRKRVKDQLYVIDETFKAEPAHFKYINLKNGLEILVETLERISNGNIVCASSTTSSNEPESNECNETEVPSDNNGTADVQTAKRPRIPLLQEKSMTFRMGQTGVSYEKLFAPYMKDAKVITVEDPYIRASWQIM